MAQNSALPDRAVARFQPNVAPVRASVVLVQRDPAWRREVRRALTRAGFAVVEATSALEGLVHASSTRAPVVATNYPMLLPGGSQLARVLTSCPELAGAAVIAVVSDARPESIAAAREDGCRVIVVRPAPAAAMVEAVELALVARR